MLLGVLLRNWFGFPCCWAYEPACEYLYPKKWVFLNNRDMCAQSWAHAIHFSEKYTNLEEFWNTFRQKIFIYPKLREKTNKKKSEKKSEKTSRKKKEN